MTETMLEQAAPVAVEEPTAGNRRTLVLAGVAAAVVLAGGGYFLLAGGSSSTPQSLAVPKGIHKTAPVTQAPAPAAKKPLAVVPPVTQVPIGRDPFKPLYVQPVAAPAAQAKAPATTTSTSTSTGSGSTTTPAAPTTYKLVLTSVDGAQIASFTVGGKLMTAKVGGVFGPTAELKLLSLSQSAKGVWTATLQEGDSDPFDAVKGSAVYVR